MSQLMNQPTKRTARKVRNAAWTAAWVAPMASILSTILVSNFPVVAQNAMEIELLITFGVTGIGTWLVGYYTRERVENMFV